MTAKGTDRGTMFLIIVAVVVMGFAGMFKHNPDTTVQPPTEQTR